MATTANTDRQLPVRDGLPRCFTLEDLEVVDFTWSIIDGQLLVSCWLSRVKNGRPANCFGPRENGVPISCASQGFVPVFSVSSAKALDAFIPSHPGGSLIHQALGTDASLLFHAHHTDLSSVLAKYCVGYMKPWHSEAGFHVTRFPVSNCRFLLLLCERFSM